jgi:DNA invertase Pin-like site-specific DNA recombinase
MRQKARSAAAGEPSETPKFVAYYRVSTQQQGASGLGIDAQKASVAAQVASVGGTVIHAFEETESGKRNDRPQLAAALATCRSAGAALIVAKIDRLARNTRFLLSVAEGTGENGVVFCDLPQLPPGPMGKFFLTLMAAVAEFEAGLISQRTKAALAQAKKRGVKLGNPRLREGATAAGLARKRDARSAAREIAPYIAKARKAGCTTLAELAEALTARGIRTPGGCFTWNAEQIRRIIARTEGRPTA